MQPGIYHTLTIRRQTSVGFYLSDGKDDVLLPNKYCPQKAEIGSQLAVFVYLDQMNRPVATTLNPYAIVGDFAFLRVAHTNEFGAFLDWGLEKDLFVPFAEQSVAMEINKRYFVYIHWDEQSGRLMASSKTDRYLSKEPFPYAVGDEVNLILGNRSPLGYQVIIEKKFKGIVYHSEVFDSLRPGDPTRGFIHQIRPDGKVDVRLKPDGVQAIEGDAEALYSLLKRHHGFIALTDSSEPEQIKTVAHMSKKAFKRAVGSLYKAHKITLEPNGIRLVD